MSYVSRKDEHSPSLNEVLAKLGYTTRKHPNGTIWVTTRDIMRGEVVVLENADSEDAWNWLHETRQWVKP